MKLTKLVMVLVSGIVIASYVEATLGDIVRAPGAVAADIVEGTTEFAGDVVDTATYPISGGPRYGTRQKRVVYVEGEPYVGTDYYPKKEVVVYEK